MLKRSRAAASRVAKLAAAVTLLAMVAPAAASANVYGTPHRTYEVVPTFLMIISCLIAMGFCMAIVTRLNQAAAERRRLRENENDEQLGEVLQRNDAHAHAGEALEALPVRPTDEQYADTQRIDVRRGRRWLIGYTLGVLVFGGAVGSILTYHLVGF